MAAPNPGQRAQTRQRPVPPRPNEAIGGPGPKPFKRFQLLEVPDTWLTWAAQFPDLVKFRKHIDLFPLQFALEAAYHREQRHMSYGCSCQDKILKGFVRLDVPSRTVHYRKRLPIGNSASLAMTAACNYDGLLAGGDPKPSFSLRYELGNGSASLGGNAVALRQRLPITRNLGVEFCGNVSLTLQTAEYVIEDGHNTFGLGEGPLNLHVEQTNLILSL